MATKTQYRVVNLNSGEVLTEWTDSLNAAHREAEECEQHETEPECKVVSREISETECQAERIEKAYRAAGLTVGRGGIKVLPSLRGAGGRPGPSHWLVVDHQRSRTYETANAAIADLDSWRG